MIRPSKDRIVIQEIKETNEITKGGLIIPAGDKNIRRGRVVYTSRDAEEHYDVDDIILYDRREAIELKHDGEVVLIIFICDIIGSIGENDT